MFGTLLLAAVVLFITQSCCIHDDELEALSAEKNKPY